MVRTTGSANNQRYVNQCLTALLSARGHKDWKAIESDKFLDNHLWSSLGQSSTDNHIVAVAGAFVAKFNCTGEIAIDAETKFKILLNRAVQIFFKDLTPWTIKSILLGFLSVLISSLHIRIVRDAVKPLFSILIWGQLSSNGNLLKTYDRQQEYDNEVKKLQTLPRKDQASTKLLISLIPTSVRIFISTDEPQNEEFIRYGTALMQLLVNILSQLPTRRFQKLFLEQQNLLIHAQLKGIEDESYKMNLRLFEYFLFFPINEFDGSIKDFPKREYTTKINKFQEIIFRDYKKETEELPFWNFKELQDHDKLYKALNVLTLPQLSSILKELDVSTENIEEKKKIRIELLIQYTKSRQDILTEVGRFWNYLPTEKSLSTFLKIQTVPTLGSQYLDLSDFVMRNYLLHLFGSFIELAQHITATVSRFRANPAREEFKVLGNSRHAVKIKRSQVIMQPTSEITSEYPQDIVMTVNLDLNNSNDTSVTEWNKLNSGDVLFFISLGSKGKDDDEFKKIGLKKLRTAIIQSKLTVNGSELDKSSKSRNFNFRVKFDSRTYFEEQDSTESYENFNLLVKIPEILQNYHRELKFINEINSQEDSIPDWLLNLFLGYNSIGTDGKNNVNFFKLSRQRISMDELQSVLKNVEEGELQTKKRRINKKQTVESKIEPPFSITLDQGKTIIKGISSGNKKLLNISTQQLDALFSSITKNFTLVDGASGTGKKWLISNICEVLSENFPSEKILIIAKHKSSLDRIFDIIRSENLIKPELLFNLMNNKEEDEKISLLSENLKFYLAQVDEIARACGLEGSYGDNIETSTSFFKYYIHEEWLKFLKSVDSKESPEQLLKRYPFRKYINIVINNEEFGNLKTALAEITKHFFEISKIFEEIENLKPLEILVSASEKRNYLLAKQAHVIGITNAHFLTGSQELSRLGLSYDNVIVYEASQMTELETIVPLIYQQNRAVKRVVLSGDSYGLLPKSFNEWFGSVSQHQRSFFKRSIALGCKVNHLSMHFNTRKEISDILRADYPTLTNNGNFIGTNPSINSVTQFIKVNDSEEIEPAANFFQNINEAEYAVRLYQMLRLQGFPDSKVSILTLDEGQRVLIDEILSKRCGSQEANHCVSSFEFGIPYVRAAINIDTPGHDYVIFSLVRSRTFKLLDERLIAAAASHSRLGLYVLGNEGSLEYFKTSKNGVIPAIIKSSISYNLSINENESFGDSQKKAGTKATTKEIKTLGKLSEIVNKRLDEFSAVSK